MSLICMKSIFSAALLMFSLLPLAAQDNHVAPSLPRERVYVGMVADEREGSGLLVRAVAPGSPAYKAGISVGDVLLKAGGVLLNSRSDLRQVVANGVRGEKLAVQLQRGKQSLSLQVVLEPRPDSLARRSLHSSAFGADRHIQPIQLPENIRQEIRLHRRLLREQLASLPDAFEPRAVTKGLQAIRDLARDAHVTRPGWMAGRAGEISVRFRDAEGSVVLYGANNQVSLELYGTDGQLISRYELNTAEDRRALPEAVLQRLRRFR